MFHECIRLQLMRGKSNTVLYSIKGVKKWHKNRHTNDRVYKYFNLGVLLLMLYVMCIFFCFCDLYIQTTQSGQS